MQIYFMISKEACLLFSGGCKSPTTRGNDPKASRKGLGDQYTKGSETAKVGTGRNRNDIRGIEKLR